MPKTSNQYNGERELLKLLKNSIYHKEEHKRTISEPIGEKFIMLHISVHGDENVKKIKDWLKDEQ